MADYDQIMRALRNAHAAGDTAAATRLAAMAKAAKPVQSERSTAMAERAAAAKAGTLVASPEALERAAGADLMAGTGSVVGDALNYAKRNIIGGSLPTEQSPGEKAGTLLNMGGESMTLGLVGDEAQAAASAAMGGSYDAALTDARGKEAQMRKEHPLLSFGADVAPALLPGIGMAKGIAAVPTLAGKAAASGVVGGLAGGTLGFMEGEGGFENRVDSAKGTGLVSGAVSTAIPVVGAIAQRTARALAERSGARAMAKGAPTVDDLRDAASKLYDAAKARGVTANVGQTQSLAGDIRGIATTEGLITPTGRIAESYPKVRDAINMVDDFAQGTMDPTQMQAVRRTFQSAAASPDPAERRIGTMMLKKFDDFVEPLAPEFKRANEIYRKAMKGELIERTIELAGSKAGQFTGSGFENALRSEFRALDKQIVKGQLKGLSGAEVAAIKRIARGGTIENIARDVGKAAPRGIVSTGLASSVPFMIGNAFGGPVVGAGAAAATLGAGEVGRRIATRMQSGNADILSGLVRSGGQMPSLPQAGAKVRGLLEAMMLGGVPQGLTERPIPTPR